PTTDEKVQAAPAPVAPQAGIGPRPDTSTNVAAICAGTWMAVTRKAICGRPCPIQQAFIGMVSASSAIEGAVALRLATPAAAAAALGAIADRIAGAASQSA